MIRTSTKLEIFLVMVLSLWELCSGLEAIKTSSDHVTQSSYSADDNSVSMIPLTDEDQYPSNETWPSLNRIKRGPMLNEMYFNRIPRGYYNPESTVPSLTTEPPINNTVINRLMVNPTLISKPLLVDKRLAEKIININSPTVTHKKGLLLTSNDNQPNSDHKSLELNSVRRVSPLIYLSRDTSAIDKYQSRGDTMDQSDVVLTESRNKSSKSIGDDPRPAQSRQAGFSPNELSYSDTYNKNRYFSRQSTSKEDMSSSPSSQATLNSYGFTPSQANLPQRRPTMPTTLLSSPGESISSPLPSAYPKHSRYPINSNYRLQPWPTSYPGKPINSSEIDQMIERLRQQYRPRAYSVGPSGQPYFRGTRVQSSASSSQNEYKIPLKQSSPPSPSSSSSSLSPLSPSPQPPPSPTSNQPKWPSPPQSPSPLSASSESFSSEGSGGEDDGGSGGNSSGQDEMDQPYNPNNYQPSHSVRDTQGDMQDSYYSSNGNTGGSNTGEAGNNNGGVMGSLSGHYNPDYGNSMMNYGKYNSEPGSYGLASLTGSPDYTGGSGDTTSGAGDPFAGLSGFGQNFPMDGQSVDPLMTTNGGFKSPHEYIQNYYEDPVKDHRFRFVVRPAGHEYFNDYSNPRPSPYNQQNTMKDLMRVVDSVKHVVYKIKPLKGIASKMYRDFTDKMKRRIKGFRQSPPPLPPLSQPMSQLVHHHQQTHHHIHNPHQTGLAPAGSVAGFAPSSATALNPMALQAMTELGGLGQLGGLGAMNGLSGLSGLKSTANNVGSGSGVQDLSGLLNGYLGLKDQESTNLEDELLQELNQALISQLIGGLKLRRNGGHREDDKGDRETGEEDEEREDDRYSGDQYERREDVSNRQVDSPEKREAIKGFPNDSQGKLDHQDNLVNVISKKINLKQSNVVVGQANDSNHQKTVNHGQQQQQQFSHHYQSTRSPFTVKPEVVVVKKNVSAKLINQQSIPSKPINLSSSLSKGKHGSMTVAAKDRNSSDVIGPSNVLINIESKSSSTIEESKVHVEVNGATSIDDLEKIGNQNLDNSTIPGNGGGGIKARGKRSAQVYIQQSTDLNGKSLWLADDQDKMVISKDKTITIIPTKQGQGLLVPLLSESQSDGLTNDQRNLVNQMLSLKTSNGDLSQDESIKKFIKIRNNKDLKILHDAINDIHNQTSIRFKSLRAVDNPSLIRSSNSNGPKPILHESDIFDDGQNGHQASASSIPSIIDLILHDNDQPKSKSTSLVNHGSSKPDIYLKIIDLSPEEPFQIDSKPGNPKQSTKPNKASKVEDKVHFPTSTPANIKSLFKRRPASITRPSPLVRPTSLVRPVIGKVPTSSSSNPGLNFKLSKPALPFPALGPNLRETMKKARFFFHYPPLVSQSKQHETKIYSNKLQNIKTGQPAPPIIFLVVTPKPGRTSTKPSNTQALQLNGISTNSAHHVSSSPSSYYYLPGKMSNSPDQIFGQAIKQQTKTDSQRNQVRLGSFMAPTEAFLTPSESPSRVSTLFNKESTKTKSSPPPPSSKGKVIVYPLPYSTSSSGSVTTPRYLEETSPWNPTGSHPKTTIIFGERTGKYSQPVKETIIMRDVRKARKEGWIPKSS